MAAQPPIARSAGYRAFDQRIDGIFGYSVDPKHLAYGVLLHLRHPQQWGAARACPAVGARSNQHHSAAVAIRRRHHARTQRKQYRLDLSIRDCRSRKFTRYTRTAFDEREP